MMDKIHDEQSVERYFSYNTAQHTFMRTEASCRPMCGENRFSYTVRKKLSEVIYPVSWPSKL